MASGGSGRAFGQVVPYTKHGGDAMSVQCLPIWLTSSNGQWLVRGSARPTGCPLTGSVPGLQFYSTVRWPHCSLA